MDRKPECPMRTSGMHFDCPTEDGRWVCEWCGQERPAQDDAKRPAGGA